MKDKSELAYANSLEEIANAPDATQDMKDLWSSYKGMKNFYFPRMQEYIADNRGFWAKKLKAGGTFSNFETGLVWLLTLGKGTDMKTGCLQMQAKTMSLLSEFQAIWQQGNNNRRFPWRMFNLQVGKVMEHHVCIVAFTTRVAAFLLWLSVHVVLTVLHCTSIIEAFVLVSSVRFTVSFGSFGLFALRLSRPSVCFPSGALPRTVSSLTRGLSKSPSSGPGKSGACFDLRSLSEPFRLCGGVPSCHRLHMPSRSVRYSVDVTFRNDHYEYTLTLIGKAKHEDGYALCSAWISEWTMLPAVFDVCRFCFG